VAAVMSIAAVYLSLYAKPYIVIIVGIMVFTGFLIYLKKTGIPGFYVIFIMMFPIMCLRTEERTSASGSWNAGWKSWSASYMTSAEFQTMRFR
jgi:hypothetical protein